MSSSRRDDNQILAPKVLLKLMTQLANFETFPSEWQENTEELKENSARGTGIHPRNKPELIEVVFLASDQNSSTNSEKQPRDTGRISGRTKSKHVKS